MGGLEGGNYCENSSPEDDMFDEICNNGKETIVPHEEGELRMEDDVIDPNVLTLAEEAELLRQSEAAERQRNEAEMDAYIQGLNNGDSDGKW